MATHDPVDGHGGEGERILVAVAAQAHEQRLLVEQPDPASERMHFEPRLERLLDGRGQGDLALAAALAAHIQAVVAGVGARTAQIPCAQPSNRQASRPLTE